jgi:hypothetical protein
VMSRPANDSSDRELSNERGAAKIHRGDEEQELLEREAEIPGATQKGNQWHRCIPASPTESQNAPLGARALARGDPRASGKMGRVLAAAATFQRLGFSQK